QYAVQPCMDVQDRQIGDTEIRERAMPLNHRQRCSGAFSGKSRLIENRNGQTGFMPHLLPAQLIRPVDLVAAE
ncbi:MAG: hypothetical protein IKJ37_15300, partial [Kiritimatiellae bacterium]|nr:hypothetical protein [Kiritimatiellia bacterium]